MVTADVPNTRELRVNRYEIFHGLIPAAVSIYFVTTMPRICINYVFAVTRERNVAMR